MSRYRPAVIIPGSIRTERRVEVRTFVTVQCGECGHKFERIIRSMWEGLDWDRRPYEPKRTAKCPACGRLVRYENAPTEELNVIPLRRSR